MYLAIEERLVSQSNSHKAVGWSRKDSDAPLYIEKIYKKQSSTEIHCVMLNLEQTYEIPFTDDASIKDVIHCIALMLYLKPTSLRNRKVFAGLEPVAMRLEVKEGINGCQLINDTYNICFPVATRLLISS